VRGASRSVRQASPGGVRLGLRANLAQFTLLVGVNALVGGMIGAGGGKGVGRALLSRLIELGRQHGFHKLVLSAFPINTGGMALYEKLGFRTVGVYKEQGLLDGKWVDTIIMEKLLTGDTP